MADYTPRVWQDRAVSTPNTYTKSAETSGSVTLVANPGTITQAGTPVNAANLNALEQGVAGSLQKSGGTVTGATSFTGYQNVLKIAQLELATDTRSLTLSYTNGDLTQVLEKDGATIVRTTNLAYTNGTLTTVTEIAGGNTVTTTLAYTNGDLTSVTKTIA
ncbi:hypothetical protein [Paenibacillus sp. Soil724D2]|uniref:hypothetical protein n=1 Tax=Paenibacillus sp. (strain Soil724D2) TaxID=1736392 RepID=UPI000713E8E6|nr:hypothetical protein [Paenibacillus sp. Soil724D2]KRE33434.1 hypothetical protein ASG85_14300 [Paenibacillus sp. Soil724D2]